MKTCKFCVMALSIVAILPAMALSQSRQSAESNGIPTHLVVTVEPHKDSGMPAINQNEVMVYEGKTRDQVTEWTPAQGEHAALQLYILIDDSSGQSLGTQLDDIRKFIDNQPASTQVGVAYMRNGTAQIVQDLTADHAAAAKSLRLPLGELGANASPYFSLSDLIKKWPSASARRAILMISDGIDAYYGGGDMQDPYVDEAMNLALRGGIMVSTIYSPGAGHFGHSYWQTYWGQLYMSQIADATGGEAYYMGFTGAPVSFSPYLNEMAARLSHQYLLTFLAKPPQKAGWQKIRLTTEVPKVDLVTADRVYLSPEK